jgi:gamma-butyrobetaine dioxygenase
MQVPLTPDFIDHDWCALETVELADGFVAMRWSDGFDFAAYSLWLAENADGYGLESSSRESTIEPNQLPSPSELVAASVGRNGELVLEWVGGRRTSVHPGWLRHVAAGCHLPDAGLPAPVAWTTTDFNEPPTIDGASILDDEAVLEQWLRTLAEFGICRLVNTPTSLDFVGSLVGSVGPIRDTNFGPVWSVQASPDPDSTANTALELGQHTDLPTRETPPGFQFLHCIENTVEGGWSRQSDGLAVVDAIRSEHPEAYEALTTLEWVFGNRSPDADHRWVGPLIDHVEGPSPLTLRAFYPVRSAPNMAPADVPRAYEALRLFATVARDPRFQIRYPFRAGDLIGFDNRRVLHGRDAFESTGTRHLRGCYADHDDLYSRLRVLDHRRTRAARPSRASIPSTDPHHLSTSTGVTP